MSKSDQMRERDRQTEKEGQTKFCKSQKRFKVITPLQRQK